MFFEKKALCFDFFFFCFFPLFLSFDYREGMNSGSSSRMDDSAFEQDSIKSGGASM